VNHNLGKLKCRESKGLYFIIVIEPCLLLSNLALRCPQ
jgi:hypothetical protein